MSHTKIVEKARSERFDRPAARDLVQAADDYVRLAHDLKTLQETQHRIRAQIATIPSPAVRRLEMLKRIDSLTLLSRKRDAAAAKAALGAALARYAA